MASHVEDSLQCPTCLDVFKDPVVLPCSHSFCRACVQKCRKQKGKRSCPVCRTEFGSMDLPLNLALQTACEAFSRASVEDVCSSHKKKLELFCLDHQEPACSICRDAKIHAGHKFCPLGEAVKDHQEKVREGLQGARKSLEDHGEIRDECNEQATHIKVQSEQVESKMKKDFQELHRWLEDEEEARLSALREEERSKTRRMKEKIAALGRDMAALTDTIQIAEEEMTSDPVSFMKNFRTTMSRIRELPAEPERLPPGALLDRAKHVGNLKFNVWQRMKENVSYSPVILDPNTAGPRLSLSEDLTSLRWQEEEQQRPKNPERFEEAKVLSSALASGTHTWDVVVGDNTHWGLGVRWGDPCLPREMEHCGIGFFGGAYTALGKPRLSLNVPVMWQRIRVQVDTDQRSLSFSDSLTNTQIGKTNPYTLPRLSGNMKMFPCFWTDDEIPLQIIPLAPRVTTQSP